MHGNARQGQYDLSEENQAGALRVAAFLMVYYSGGGHLSSLREPLSNSLNTLSNHDASLC
jgi:DNA (cytosine-5)-methyltransferase 1